MFKKGVCVQHTTVVLIKQRVYFTMLIICYNQATMLTITHRHTEGAPCVNCCFLILVQISSNLLVTNKTKNTYTVFMSLKTTQISSIN